MVKVETLFSPEIPMLGMRSYPPPAALGRGEMSQITNWRLGEGLPRTRWGVVRTGATPDDHPLAATDFCLGAGNVNVGGTDYMVSWWSSTGGSTRAHIFSLNLSTGVWTEWTSTSSAGKYGETTTASYDVGRASFSVVRDTQSSKEYIIASHGVNTVVIDPTVSTASEAARSNAVITPPAKSELFATILKFPKYFTVNDETTTTLTTGTATRFVAADQGTSPENYIRLTRDTTASTDPTRVIQFGSAVDLSDCRQLIVLHDTVVPFWWDIVGLEISEDGVTYSTVWNPESPTGKVSVAHDPRTTRAFTAFPLDHVDTASRNAIAYFRFTYYASAPSSSQTFDIFGIFGSGKVPGQCFHALTYLNSGSRSESIGLLCENILPDYCKNMGTMSLTNARLPNDEALYYDYQINFQNTSTAQKDLGVDTLLVYRNDPGDPDGRFTYVTSVSLATADNPFTAWSFASGAANAQRSTTDTTPTSDKNEYLLAPDSATTPLIGVYGHIAMGTRLVAADRTTVSYSEDAHPFRFRKRRASEFSGTSRKLNGESFMAFAPGPVSSAGIESIYIVTDKNVYLSTGVKASELTRWRLVATRGTYYPRSVVSDKGVLYFLDTGGEVIRYVPGNGEQVLSENTVADKFTGLDGTTTTGQYEVSAEFVNERYILSYATTLSLTPTDRRKATPMVWETRINPKTGREWGWMQDDFAGSSITCEWIFRRKNQAYMISADGYVYTYEYPTQTTDQGTTFTSVLNWGLLHNEMRVPFSVGHIALVMDDCASGTVAWTRTFRPDGSTLTSSTVLDVSTAQQWTEDKGIAFGTAGKGSGIGCQISASFSVPGGSRLYGVQYEFKPEDGKPKASA